MVKKKSMRVQARPPRSARKVVSPAGALTRFCRLFGAISWSKLAAAGSGGHIGSCSAFFLYKLLPVDLYKFFIALTLLYYATFNGFLLLIHRPKIMTIKRNSQGQGHWLGVFEHTPLRSDELLVNLSLQLFCYCNFSSLPLPPMLLLSCGSALTVITFNCTERKKK